MDPEPPQLKSMMTREEYAEAISAPRLDPANPNKKKGMMTAWVVESETEAGETTAGEDGDEPVTEITGIKKEPGTKGKGKEKDDGKGKEPTKKKQPKPKKNPKVKMETDGANDEPSNEAGGTAQDGKADVVDVMQID